MKPVNLLSQTSYRGPIKAVVFDLAGTLIDFGSCAPAGAFVTLFDNYQIKATLEQAREPMGMHKRDHIRTMMGMSEIALQWENQHGRAWNERDVQTLYEDFIPLQLDALPHFGALIPGALKTVTSLKRRGIQIGTSTGYNHDMCKVVLDQATEQGLIPDAAVCGADVPCGRPAPWMIFRLMQELDVYPPAAVVKVGDTIADIESGLNAGVWSVGVTQTGNMLGLSEKACTELLLDELNDRTREAEQKMLNAGAHYVIEGVTQLPDIISQIETCLRDQETFTAQV